MVLVLELGADTLRRVRARLTIVDTPERGEPGWEDSVRFTTAWLYDRAGHLAVDLPLTSSGRPLETFGRYFADVIDTRDGSSLSSDLLQSGLATVWS
jgi:endonuclease YncB( thermonuclease family)